MKKDSCYEIAEDMIFYLEIETTLEGFASGELKKRQKGEKDREEIQNNLEAALEKFYCLCKKNNLPLCNPIAFFSALLKNENWENIPPHDLEHILQRALGGDGFIFSSVFDRFTSKTCVTKRPVDCVNSPDQSDLSRAISEQVKLNGWFNYFQQQQYLQDQVFEIILGDFREYKLWYAMATECKKLPEEKENQKFRFRPEDSLYGQIFKIYEEYCIMQLGDTPKSNEVTAIKEDLSEILEVMTFLTELHSFFLELQEILSESEDILTKKNQWLAGFIEYLKREDTKKLISLAEKKTTRSQIPAMGLQDYLVMATMTTPSSDRLNQYPLWDTTKSLKKLSKNDKNALTEYQHHPLFKWFKSTEVVLRKESMIPVAPLYFTTLLIHKKKPTNNFYKKQKNFSPATPSISLNDEPSHDYQMCHSFLLMKLMQCFEENGYCVSEKICIHLFLQQQNFLIQRNYNSKSIDIHEFLKMLYPYRPLNSLYFHIKETLSLSGVALPEYTEAKSVSGSQMVLEEYSRKELTQRTNILKKLKKIVTFELAQEYCDLFLSPCDGLGVGLHSREWHLSLAQWLDKVINLDEDLIDFVEPSHDMKIDGTYVTVVEQHMLQKENRGDIIVSTARLSPHLSQVQVTIQRLCIDMIAEKLSKEVFCLYKRLFWNFELLYKVSGTQPHSFTT